RRNDSLYINTRFKGGKQNKDEYNIDLFYTINEESESVVGVRPSDVTFRNNKWFINRENKNATIVFDNSFRNIRTDTIQMMHEQQEISFFGMKNGTNNKDL